MPITRSQRRFRGMGGIKLTRKRKPLRSDLNGIAGKEVNETDAIETIRARGTEYLQRDGSGKGYVCPICGSGSGKKGTGITTKDGKHFTCWTGCFTNADIIDIIGLERGLTEFPDKLKAAADAFGIELDEPEPIRKSEHVERKIPENVQEEPDFLDFLKEARRHIQETDYPTKRGLSQEVLKRFGIGFCQNWKHPKSGPGAPISPRLIIPTSRYSYLARDTRDEVPEEQKRYCKSKAGNTHILNVKAVFSSEKPIFVVEGEIDALSIIEVGGEAVGLGSTSMVSKLLEELKGQKPAQPLIVALDNDGPGQKAAKTLMDGLAELEIEFYEINPAGVYKDANECLVKDRQALVNIVDAVSTADKLREYVQSIKREKYIQETSAAAHLQEFINGISESANTPAVRTGFRMLDDILDGGLFPGLYVLGAISSLGKTSLVLQIADRIAEKGKDVLIFSLEMARTELMAKSISRHTLWRVIKTGGEVRNAKTTRGITSGERYSGYTNEEKQLIIDSIKDYSKYADHIFILEGVGDIGIDQIKSSISNHISITGNKPIVFIDYLQIIAPYNVKYTDKQNTDKAVLKLKRISRDYMVPVVAISSLNRDNYNTKINMGAFKESGMGLCHAA